MKNLDLVKKLREITNVGYAECVKALKETKNNIDEAIKWIRLYSKQKIIKKSSNPNKEGNVLADFKGNVGYILVLNSETDFVSNTDMFKKLQYDLINIALNNQPAGLNQFLELKVKEEETVNDFILDVASKFKENISISKFLKLTLSKPEQWFWKYNHANRLASSLVIFEGTKNEEVADDICMQIVAAKPKYLSIASVPKNVIQEERDIINQEISQAGTTNRPANIIEKIIDGKMNKFYTENCLLEQPFIKQPKLKINDYLKNNKLAAVDFLYEEIAK